MISAANTRYASAYDQHIKMFARLGRALAVRLCFLRVGTSHLSRGIAFGMSDDDRGNLEELELFMSGALQEERFSLFNASDPSGLTEKEFLPIMR